MKKNCEIKSFIEAFKGSDKFYLADPNKKTIKKNGGERWAVKESSYEFPNLSLEQAIERHLDGTLGRGVVLPPIRRSDSKCCWGAIDIDGNIYKDDDFKKEILNKIQRFNLPLTACFSKSKGLHLFIKFNDWTDAKLVVDILHTFLNKLDLPQNTECFPKQKELKADEIGNGIMLPYMLGYGNYAISEFRDGDIEITNDIEKFVGWFLSQGVDASEIEIDLPKPEKKKDDYETDNGLSKWEILKGIKNKTIEEHPTMGGKYHSWIQVVIAKAVKGDWGDNEILKLIKEVHQDNRGIGYVWPESYQKQINYTRRENRLNKPNPGDTKFLEKQNLETASKLEDIKKTYCYVMANDMYNKLGSGEFYQAIQINNFHAHEVFIEKGTLTNKLLKSKKFNKAETFITSAKYKPGLINVDRPGIIPLINNGIVLNIYIPNYLTEKKGDVEFLIEFFIWLIGEEKWRIIEKWIAYMLIYPGEKIKWSIVLVSVVEGVGKGLLARILSRILGSDNVNENANYKHLANTHNTLLIGKQVVVLNELSLGDFKSKNEGTNTLKNFVGDDTYSCNFKGKPMVILPNLTNFMLFSNDEAVLGLKQGVRRYFFCNITKTEEEIIKKTDEGLFKRAWDFVDSDEGASALIYYFKKEVDMTDTDMFKMRAPETDDLKQLIEQSKHPLQKKLEHDLHRPDLMNRKIFDSRWCGLITFNELNEALNTHDKEENKNYNWGTFGDDAILKFLSANAIRWNNGEATRQISINGVKHRFYLLDDARCLIPGKSYKDLTPKQIETIYLNYVAVSKEIREEEKNYNDAVHNLPDRVLEVMTMITEGASYKKIYKKEIPEDVFNKLINGKEKLGHNDQFTVEVIIKYNKIIARGIRTPEQILEVNKIKEKIKVVEELKVEPKEELGAGDGLHFGQGDF
jgi:hypothetical protein